MFYKVVIEAGQMRAGENFQIIRYVEADNTVHLFDILEEMPGLLTEDLGYSVTMVKAISQSEFLMGRREEESKKQVLRLHFRFQIKKACRILLPDSEGTIDGETIDLSAGGLGLTFCTGELRPGMKVRVTISELQLQEKGAEVVWTARKGEKHAAGLRWL